MPVYQLLCPDCGHHFQGFVLLGTRLPEEWVCSRCGSRRARPRPDLPPMPHPWEQEVEPGGHGSGLCPCCS